MANQKYEVVGAVRINNTWKPYTTVVEAPSEGLAVERMFCTIGSKHRLKRNYISVKAVNVVAGE
ncbi:ribosomal LX protein [Methanoculleus taiwanensis]|uniref:Large ribosomal subunit protein eL20 n=1 Tax=Methanoculleus taiwanensis TaxID=1550565 RepID=A0A498H479_9EURY|nr:50S ribosomal protein L18Ae [Methanoculleus taiwanensis]RXE57257.1 ribosomal LX protein [Methanoculleus taiwanensis]